MRKGKIKMFYTDDFSANLTTNGIYKCDEVILTFENFYDFYVINPDRFELHPFGIRYSYPISSKYYLAVSGKRVYTEYDYFVIKMKDWIDCCQYKAFYKKLQKEKEMREQCEDTSRFLGYVQQDIYAIKERAQREIATGIENTQKILEKLPSRDEDDKVFTNNIDQSPTTSSSLEDLK